MKQQKMRYLYLFLFTCFLNSCEPTNTPRGVAEAFINCMKNEDFEKAKLFCTTETAGLVLMGQGFGSSGVYQAENYKFEKELINGNEATVYFKGKSGDSQITKLELVDGKWKVKLGK